MRFLRKILKPFKALATSVPLQDSYPEPLGASSLGSLLVGKDWGKEENPWHANPATPAVSPHQALSEEQRNPPQPGRSTESLWAALASSSRHSSVLHGQTPPAVTFLRFCIRVLLQVSAGRGEQEDVAAGWPTSWIPATGGSSPPLGSGNVHFTLCSHSGSHFQGGSLETAMWRSDHHCRVSVTEPQ